IVFFDIETSGFANSADILQLAAKKNRKGSVSKVVDLAWNASYIQPTQPVVAAASAVTGLTVVDDELYLNDVKVKTISLKESLENFLKFLRVSPKPSILVAHNAKFDAKHLKSTIKGFTDTLVLFKKQFLDRKGKGLFKLSQLTKDLLPHRKTDNFHEAMFDVEILEELVYLLILSLRI
ncbi:GSCOCG00012356001-RA-CDS, partial [Cotesia congregata]